MIGSLLSPGLILILGAVLVPLLRGRARSAYMLALPIIAFWHLIGLPYGEFGQIQVFGIELTTLRIDRLSAVFGYIFLIAAFLGMLYALHVEDTLQHVAALVYAGSAVGAVFAGDLITLFVYWEGTAIASVFLIWASRTERAYAAGLRYLVVQVGSGVLLLAGVALHYRATGSIAFGQIVLGSAGGWLIFLAFGIKCAFPLLHNWLQDSYPEATVSGTVILSAFTTKLAVYALARGFAGTEILVPIGVTMAIVPLVYAAVENDLRRALAYVLNNQLGFMVVGVGIGTELAISGTVAHAFSHIIYDTLLFMALGAVLYRTGSVKSSDLGMISRSMPWTAGFWIVGALSISAVPLFVGFVSKSLIIAAAMKEGHFWAWLMLVAASAGVFMVVGLRMSKATFFSPDSGKRVAEAPVNMLIAMGLSAALCVLIGVFPQPLYDLLPFKVDFAAYTVEHVVTQLQLLFLSALAFTVLMRTGLYPPELRSVNLDFDWIYRRGGYDLAIAAGRTLQSAWDGFARSAGHAARGVVRGVYRHHGPEGMLARTWPTGNMAFWTTVLLAAYLVLSYLSY